MLHRGWSKLHGLRPWVLKLLRHKDAYIACLGGVSIHMSFYLTSVSVCFAPPPQFPLFFPLSFGQVAFGILVPQPGVKPAPPAVEAQSINNWAIREVTFIYLRFGHGGQDLPQPRIKPVPACTGTMRSQPVDLQGSSEFPFYL